MSHILFISKPGAPGILRVIETLENTGRTDLLDVSWCCYRNNEQKGNIVWTSLDVVKETVAQTNNLAEVKHDLKQTTDSIHSLADELPSTDCQLDVFLWPPEKTDGSDYVLFLGALRRLKDWHNANFTIFDAELSSATEFLQKFTSASVHFREEDYVADERLSVWRGKVSVFDKVENKGFLVPGVSMTKQADDTPALTFPVDTNHHTTQCAQTGGCRVGRMLEVLDEVNLASIPAFFTTPHRYKLCLFQKHAFAQVFMNYIQENDQTGVLARLAVYPIHRKSPSCAEVGLSTQAWKDNIMADVQYTQEPEEELQDNYEFQYFIIKPVAKTFPAKNFTADVHLLNHPYCISGRLATTIFHQSLAGIKGSNSEDNGSSQDFDLSGLPYLSIETLQHMQRDITLLQKMVVQHLLESKQKNNQSTVIQSTELMGLLCDVRKQYLQTLKEKLPQYKADDTSQTIDWSKQVFEACGNSYEWRERLVQQYLESQKRALSRIHSTDSMPLSSPIQHAETSTTVDVNSFLKFFQADGSAAGDNLSPVRRRRANRVQGKLLTPDTDSPLLTSWPESKDVVSHDVYYNSDRKAEKINSHLNRLQEKFVKDETYSSCLSRVVVFPKSVRRRSGDTALLDLRRTSELRRSPRKKAAPSRFDEQENDWNVSQGSKKSRPSLGRLSDVGTPLALVRDSDSRRRYSTPHPLPQHRRASVTAASGDSKSRRQSDAGTGQMEAPASRQTDKRRRESDVGTSSGKESRSDRHRRRLQDIVDRVLEENGVTSSDPIYKSCSSRLYKVTKLFVMDLPNSFNLKEEMKKIAEGQVKQVIEVDRQRQKNKQK